MMGCPPDEECDPTTPSGLNFAGESPSDVLFANTLPTAAGGAQHFRIRSAASGGSVPDAFDVVSDDPEVFVVDAIEGRDVTVRGIAAGSALLRVVNDMGELFDRTTLQIEAIDRVEIGSIRSLQDELYTGERREWVFLRGGRADIVFALYDADGDRLIDSSLAPEGEIELDRWDSAIVDLPAEGELLELPVTAGGALHRPTAPLVGEVTELVRVGDEPADLLRAPTITAGSPQTLCFTPMDTEDRPIAGVAFELALEGPITATVDNDPSTNTFEYGCVEVTGTEPGDAELTVIAPGIEKVLPMTVVE